MCAVVCACVVVRQVHVRFCRYSTECRVAACVAPSMKHHNSQCHHSFCVSPNRYAEEAEEAGVKNFKFCEG